MGAATRTASLLMTNEFEDLMQQQLQFTPGFRNFVPQMAFPQWCILTAVVGICTVLLYIPSWSGPPDQSPYSSSRCLHINVELSLNWVNFSSPLQYMYRSYNMPTHCTLGPWLYRSNLSGCLSTSSHNYISGVVFQV